MNIQTCSPYNPYISFGQIGAGQQQMGPALTQMMGCLLEMMDQINPGGADDALMSGCAPQFGGDCCPCGSQPQPRWDGGSAFLGRSCTPRRKKKPPVSPKPMPYPGGDGGLDPSLSL